MAPRLPCAWEISRRSSLPSESIALYHLVYQRAEPDVLADVFALAVRDTLHQVQDVGTIGRVIEPTCRQNQKLRRDVLGDKVNLLHKQRFESDDVCKRFAR